MAEMPVKITASMNDYADAMREYAYKARHPREIPRPLWNTIRSFWTPETSNDPAFLRAIRADKTVFILSAAALSATVAGLTLCAVGIINTLS